MKKNNIVFAVAAMVALTLMTGLGLRKDTAHSPVTNAPQRQADLAVQPPPNWPPPTLPPESVRGYSQTSWEFTLTNTIPGYIVVSYHPSTTIQLIGIVQLRDEENNIVASQTFTPGIYPADELGTGDFGPELTWTWDGPEMGREFICHVWRGLPSGDVFTVVELPSGEISWQGEDGCSPTGRWIWKRRWLPLVNKMK